MTAGDLSSKQAGPARTQLDAATCRQFTTGRISIILQPVVSSNHSLSMEAFDGE